MKQSKGHIIALSPGDIEIQIIPEFIHETLNDNNTIMIPEPDLGYTIPLKMFLVDRYTMPDVFCGVFDITTLYFNDSIRRDILDELYRDGVRFDIYIRQHTALDSEVTGPKIIAIYNDCYFYRQELCIPELGMTTGFRYHFTNSEEPWEIPVARISELRPPNQYMYDYAVSKAVKNLQYPINSIYDILKELVGVTEKSGPKIVTAAEYVKLVETHNED